MEGAVSVEQILAEDKFELLREMIQHESPQDRGKTLHTVIRQGVRELRDLNRDKANNGEAIEIAKTKNMEFVKFILDFGVDVNADTFFDYTPFTYACLRASADIVKLLMDYGADLELDNETGNEPIQNAFESGDKEKIDLFFDLVNAENVNQWELLNIYVENSNPQEEIMSKLLQIGANVNGIDDDGLPVLYGAVLNKNLDCLKFLIKSGADVNESGGNDCSLLQWALENLVKDAVYLLLNRGADPNLGSSNLISVALRWYGENSQRIIRLLLSYGTDINKHDNESSPVSVALELGHERMSKFLIRTIILMKAQDLHVSDENLHASDAREQFCLYQRECVEEIELLKEEKFKDSSLSCFDIFEIKDVRKLGSLARNENIVRVLKSDDFREKFPIYWDTIAGHFEPAIGNKADFEFLGRFFNYLSTRDHDRLPKLPFTFICELFKYLRWEDFNNLWALKNRRSQVSLFITSCKTYT